MTRDEKVEAVGQYLGDLLKGGNNSISVEDAYAVGDETLGAAVADILDVEEPLPELLEDLLPALRTMMDVWSGGFDMASFDDFVDDHHTVRDLVETFLDASEPENATPSF